jgi:SPP1 gp7 family putative phage head morphogenesis protein
VNLTTILSKTQNLQDKALLQTTKSLKSHATRLYLALLSIPNYPFKDANQILQSNAKPLAITIAQNSASIRQQAEQLSLQIVEPHLHKKKQQNLAIAKSALISVQNRSITELTEMYLPSSLKEVDLLHDAFGKAIQRSITESIRSGEHTNSAIARMKETLNQLGLSLKSNAYETIARTELHKAFEDGRQSINDDPAIQSILLGYTYHAIQDSRTRPEHMQYDGVEVSKNDPLLITLRGLLDDYQCRCTLTESFID